MPGVIAWPLIAFMTLVLVGRYRWCSQNLYEKYFNSTLALLGLAQLLREQLVENMLVTTNFMTLPGTWQLGTAVMSYSYTEFVGFILLWSGFSEAQTRRRHKYFRLAGVLFVAGFLIAGTGARVASESVEYIRGWQSVVTLTCVTAMLMVDGLGLIWLSVRELRTASRRRERLIAISTLTMGAAGATNVVQEAVLQMTDQLGWTHTADLRQQYHASGLFFMIVGIFATAAVPLVIKLLRALGLDPISRGWSALQPLRQALRTVVPECAFDLDDDEPGRRKTELQLHHTVVEIRDAMLRLRPYFRDIPDQELTRFLSTPHPVAPVERDAALAALRLAHAAAAKAAGATPQPVDSALVVASQASTLRQEAAELVALAAWWPAAYAAAEHLVACAAHTTTKANQPI